MIMVTYLCDFTVNIVISVILNVRNIDYWSFKAYVINLKVVSLTVKANILVEIWDIENNMD